MAKVCGEIIVDINGLKGSNTMGNDQFMFYFTPKGIFPVGLPNDNFSVDNYCNPSKSMLYNGYGCTAWVLQKEERPWLRGKTVSWNKKTEK